MNKTIEKALECCRDKNCTQCPCFDDDIECGEVLIGFTIDYINRLKAEKERLQKENAQFADIGKMYSEIRAEAIKEFAERLKEKTFRPHLLFGDLVCVDSIDNLVKEMTEKE